MWFHTGDVQQLNSSLAMITNGEARVCWVFVSNCSYFLL